MRNGAMWEDIQQFIAESPKNVHYMIGNAIN